MDKCNGCWDAEKNGEVYGPSSSERCKECQKAAKAEELAVKRKEQRKSIQSVDAGLAKIERLRKEALKLKLH